MWGKIGKTFEICWEKSFHFPGEYVKTMPFSQHSHFEVHFRVKECHVKMDSFFSNLKIGLKSTYVKTCI